MARKKLSLIIQAINLFNSLSETDQVTLAEYVYSQLRTPRTSSKRASRQSRKGSPRNQGDTQLEPDFKQEPQVAD